MNIYCHQNNIFSFFLFVCCFCEVILVVSSKKEKIILEDLNDLVFQISIVYPGCRFNYSELKQIQAINKMLDKKLKEHKEKLKLIKEEK